MRVITFSRIFPSYHPKKGHPTFFVEKLWQSIYMDNVGSKEFEQLDKSVFDIGLHGQYEPKHHTIRAGNRWKVGDKFSPRVWSGKPYNSKQIIIAPDIEIKKIWPVELRFIIRPADNGKYRTGSYEFMINDKAIPTEIVAVNDGLGYHDLRDWFKIYEAMSGLRIKHELFTGQIICWNENIEY